MTQTTERAPTRQIARQTSGGALAKLTDLKPATLERLNSAGYPMIRLALIQQQIARDATMEEFVYFMERCLSTGLDPLRRQIYFVKRRDNRSPTGFTCAHQVGIDGFRAIAEDTGLYAGSDAPEFLGEAFQVAGKDAHEICRVTVWKIVAGVRCPFVGEARWSEFYPGDSQGTMWRQYPHNQLAKCAEAQGLRKGFPVKLGELSIAVDGGPMDRYGEAEVIDAALSMGSHTEPEYIEVTNPNTGEMKQVRAGDEYVRMQGEQGEDVQRDPAPVARSQPPRTDYAEGNATARRASQALSEVIDQPSNAPPEPPDDDDRMVAVAAEHDDAHAQASGRADGSDSSTSNEAAESEPAELGPTDYDYQMCVEIFQSHPGLTLDKPLPRLKPKDYADWHAKYVKALDANGGIPF